MKKILFFAIGFLAFAALADDFHFETKCFVSLCKNPNGCGSIESKQVDGCVKNIQSKYNEYKCSSKLLNKENTSSAFKNVVFSSTCQVIEEASKEMCPSGTSARPFNFKDMNSKEVTGLKICVPSVATQSSEKANSATK